MTHEKTSLTCLTCSRRLGRIGLLLALWGLSASIPLLAQLSSDHPIIHWCRMTHNLTGRTGQTLGWAAAVLFLIGAVRAIWALVGGMLASHRLMAAFQALRSPTLPRTLSEAIPAALTSHLWFISSSHPVALTVGFFRPRIVLSDAALHGLTESEIRAVLCHEDAHRANRDPLRQLFWSALVKGFGFIPGFRAAVAASRSCAELRADALAAGHMGGTEALRQALLKMARHAYAAVSLVSTGFTDELILRARHLVGQDVSDSIQVSPGRPLQRVLSLCLYAPAAVSLLLPVCLPK